MSDWAGIPTSRNKHSDVTENALPSPLTQCITIHPYSGRLCRLCSCVVGARPAPKPKSWNCSVPPRAFPHPTAPHPTAINVKSLELVDCASYSLSLQFAAISDTEPAVGLCTRGTHLLEILETSVLILRRLETQLFKVFVVEISAFVLHKKCSCLCRLLKQNDIFH